MEQKVLMDLFPSKQDLDWAEERLMKALQNESYSQTVKEVRERIGQDNLVDLLARYRRSKALFEKERRYSFRKRDRALKQGLKNIRKGLGCLVEYELIEEEFAKKLFSALVGEIRSYWRGDRSPGRPLDPDSWLIYDLYNWLRGDWRKVADFMNALFPKSGGEVWDEDAVRKRYKTVEHFCRHVCGF